MVGSYHDQVIGTLLVASWFHTALYLAEMMQAYSYLKTFRHDGRTTRLLVIVCCIVDTVALVGIMVGCIWCVVLSASS
ncbi:hypothetical protein FB45DRAFT_934967 [Roridomyces roridus]|uniref:Uncharacterized protein n=1 Tax=Roridomyces roridus TaxID=1738132 RepID=A0AAD7BAV9_9AGAR|nr:hypothetical protein FB45DRAFT_934967 [Roridomyces roridus]